MDILHVLQPAGIHRSRVIHISKKRSVLYLQYSSKNSVINFTAVRYSLQKGSETILCLKLQFTGHMSPVSCVLEFMEARKLATK